MTDQLTSNPSKDVPAPPAWADSKAREQMVNEWSHVLGEVRPDDPEPGEEVLRVELLQHEEVEFTTDPPSVLRFPPTIWVNGNRYRLDQATVLAELIAAGVALAGEG
jgi:hypothetical protein